jgi:transcriptional regulator with XRE-family HTH domain
VLKPPDPTPLIAARLQAFRKSQLISRVAMADQLGITVDRLANYELGRTPLPWGLVSKLWRTLHLAPRWLATGEGPAAVDPYMYYPLIQPLAVERRFTSVYSEVLAPYIEEELRRERRSKEQAVEQLNKLRKRDPAGTRLTPFQRKLLERLLEKVAAGDVALDLESIVGGKRRFDNALVNTHLPSVQTSLAKDWEALRAQIKKLTARRGERVALANYLGVSRQVVSAWLSGRGVPDAHKTLKLLHWASEAGGQQKETAAVLLTPRRRKAQVSKSIEEKPDSRPPRK